MNKEKNVKYSPVSWKVWNTKLLSASISWTRVVNVRRLIQHEAVDSIRQEGGGHTVAGDVTDAHDEMLLVLEVHRRIVTADAICRSKIADDLDLPTPLIGWDHASVDELSNAKVQLKTPLSASARLGHTRFLLIY